MNKAFNLDQALFFFSDRSINKSKGILCVNSYRESIIYDIHSACDFFNEEKHF